MFEIKKIPRSARDPLFADFFFQCYPSTMERIVMHLDMDAFFAQIEERENPRFKGKPLVVGADPKEGKGRGVVSTANYEARKYGIRSALPISQAFKLCPEAVFLPPNILFYEKVSERIMEILKKFSPVFEISSLDEAFLDLSFVGSFSKAEDLAKKIKKEIFEKEKLICTIGIGSNKVIAKMATNKAKPDGLLAVSLKETEKFLDPLPIREIPGVGPKTEEKLKALNVETVKDLKDVSKKDLERIFGKNGLGVYEIARGRNDDPVCQREEAKSLSRSFTFEKDTREADIIFSAFERMTKEIFSEAEKESLPFRTLWVTCRFSGFETKRKETTFPSRVKYFSFFEKESKKILLKLMMENSKPIRMIGMGVKVDRS